MAVFQYSMSEEEAKKAFKQGFMGQGIGNVAILSEKGNVFTLGAPLMTVKVEFKSGTCTTKGNLAGKMLETTVNSKIELIDGFTRVS